MRATITPYRDGPYLIRGSFSLVDQDGKAIPVARRTIALCRCGKSKMRPFCDGTHRSIAFHAPSTAEVPERSGPAREEQRLGGENCLDAAHDPDGSKREELRRAGGEDGVDAAHAPDGAKREELRRPGGEDGVDRIRDVAGLAREEPSGQARMEHEAE